MAVSVMAGIPALKDLYGDLKRRMDQAVATFQSQLSSTRTGRASAHMLDAIKVDYYGTPTPVSQMAQVSTPEAQLILIQPYDPSIVKEIEKAIPRYRSLKIDEDGALLWWIEFGGRLDTVFQTEDIKWELWRIVYGVWDYFKNSGKFPEAENLALEWIGTIPGKRESRRFEGDYMLNQQDVIRQRDHADAVGYGGWALDLHPADGVYSHRAPCTHFHSKGPYPVPYRIMYSRNIVNLFLAGRVLSCSHVSFGSLRNMASLGYCAQAAGVAAAVSVKENLLPADLSAGRNLERLLRALLRSGQHIPGRKHAAPDDAALSARITAPRHSSSSSSAEVPKF